MDELESLEKQAIKGHIYYLEVLHVLVDVALKEPELAKTNWFQTYLKITLKSSNWLKKNKSKLKKPEFIFDIIAEAELARIVYLEKQENSLQQLKQLHEVLNKEVEIDS